MIDVSPLTIILFISLVASMACFCTFLTTRHFYLKKNRALKAALQQAQNQAHDSDLKLTKLQTLNQVQSETLEQTKNQLKSEFRFMADQIFEQQSKSFKEQNQTSLSLILNPLKQQIENFEKRSNQIHADAIKGTATLEKELQNLLNTGLKMSQEANALTLALKGEKKTLGNWGEMQLQTALESAGLIENDHYHAQRGYKDDQGKTKFPDFVVQLPGNKHIVIDSKVSLIDYSEAATHPINSKPHQDALQAHFKAVKNHVDDLSKKDYSQLIGIKSPNFVLMFIPIEPAYLEVIKQNYALFDYAYQQSIVLVSYTTLLPILKTISNLWITEKSNKEAKALSKKAGDIYNQVSVLAEHLLKLGSSLSSVGNHYNRSVRALAGQQGLYKKVEIFNQVSTKTHKNLPDIEPMEMDLESARLTLIAESASDTGTKVGVDDQQNNEAKENKT